MQLDQVLNRCRGYEERAAAVYRAFAARTRAHPELCAMWTALAREEDEHAQHLARAAGWLETPDGWHTHLDGWAEALDEIETRLVEAEGPDIGGDPDRQLATALALERTEIDTLYHRLLRLTGTPDALTHPSGHVERLLALAATRSDPAVQLEAALLGARVRLRDAP